MVCTDIEIFPWDSYLHRIIFGIPTTSFLPHSCGREEETYLTTSAQGRLFREGFMRTCNVKSCARISDIHISPRSTYDLILPLSLDGVGVHDISR